MNDQQKFPTEVVITDVSIPFGSMVVLIFKWVLASIPALFMLVVLGAVLFGVLGGLWGGVGAGLR